MKAEHQDIALYHYYLVSAFLAEIERRGESCNDVFGIGEDCLVREFYPYSVAIYQCVLMFEEQSNKWRDSYIFEFAERAAAQIWRSIDSQQAPELEADLPSLYQVQGMARQCLDSLV